MNNKISLIIAYDSNGGIGKKNDLAWHISEDMKHFREITSKSENNVVIMGRKTWDSIPNKFKPLPNRTNTIITRNTKYISEYNNVEVFNSLEDSIKYYQNKENIDEIFLIGGGELYNYALGHNLIDKIYLTKVKHTDNSDFGCDTFLKYDIEGKDSLFTLSKSEEVKYAKKNKKISYQFQEFILK